MPRSVPHTLMSPSQMGELRDAILREASRRTGCVPITVCHQVEQCLRETEVSWQDAYGGCDSLGVEVGWKGGGGRFLCRCEL